MALEEALRFVKGEGVTNQKVESEATTSPPNNIKGYASARKPKSHYFPHLTDAKLAVAPCQYSSVLARLITVS